MFQKRNMDTTPDEIKSNISDVQVNRPYYG